MRKNGFTLIELLAVIVILAIIALIATPIILGIINDARSESEERSVELYASAVRNAVAAYQLTGTKAPETFTDLDVKYDGDVVCSVQELYEDGSFYLEGCKVNNGAKEYSYGTKKVKLNDVCEPSEEQYFADSPLEAGYKYECKVDPNKEPYIFYVLNSNSKSVNLIMDSNINKSGEAVKESVEDKGFVAWITKEDYIRPEIGGTEESWKGKYSDGNWDKGPITAMNYLQTATAGWSNVNSQTINTLHACDYKGVCEEIPMVKTYNINARLPYSNELNDYTNSKLYAYLYDNLNMDCWDAEYYEQVSCDVASNFDGVIEEGINQVLGVLAYWTLTSSTDDSNLVFYSFFFGNIEANHFPVDFVEGVGVRPVINLSI